MIRTSDVGNGFINVETARYVSQAVYERRIQRGVPEENDIIITREAPLGEVGRIPANTKVCLGQRLIHYRPDPNKVNPRYLLYALLSPSVQAEFHANKGVGSVVDNLRMSIARSLLIPLPPRNYQDFIGDVLGSLDDKLELNRRMNATLETTARAIFQSWFVDFDPVHAKARGEQPVGMDAEIAALFPDAFEDSELGAIPTGWGVEPMGGHFNASRGLSYKGAGLSDEGIPMHNLNSIYEGGGYKHKGIKYYTGDYQARHIARAGDVIVANTEQGHHVLLIGYPAIIPQRYGEIGLYSHHLYKLEPLPDSPLTPRYIYMLMRTDYFHDVVGGYTNGTTVTMLPIDGLQRPLIVVPPAELVQHFDALAVSILAKIEMNHEETERLAETRDALLPKLISGEVRVE